MAGQHGSASCRWAARARISRWGLACLCCGVDTQQLGGPPAWKGEGKRKRNMATSSSKFIPYLFPTPTPHFHQAAGSRGPQTQSGFRAFIPVGCASRALRSTLTEVLHRRRDNVTPSNLHHHRCDEPITVCQELL